MAPKPLFNHKAGACCHDSGESPGHVRGQQTGETPSPIPAMGNMPMALNVQMVLSENKLIGEKIVTPRIVNQQTLDYDAFCDYLAQGSTVTAADVSAVMKQLEKNIPLILGLNARSWLRPTVSPSVPR